MENKVDNGESGRRRFIRRLTTFGAAGGIATLLYGRVAEKPLIQLAQAASGDYMFKDYTNTSVGTTELDSDLTTSGSDVALKVVASANSGTMRAIYGESPSPLGRGVEGYASTSVSASGNAAGVYGHTDAPNTVGVRGIATATSSYMYSDVGGAGPFTAGVEGYAPGGVSGPVQGVYGHSDSMEGCGVWGVATATSGEGCGVAGYSESPDGAGVFGHHWATGGWAAGVAGRTDSPEGNGVWGRNFVTSGVEVGMTPRGVYGRADANGGTWADGPWPRGVEGYAAGSIGAGSGVYGHTDLPDGDGVTGIAPNCGVYGEATLPTGAGVWGSTNAGGGSDWNVGPWPKAVFGYAAAGSGTTTGVAGRSDSPDGIGVSGYGSAQTGGSTGVYGRSDSPNGYGVAGWSKGICVEGYAMTPSAMPFRAVGASGQTAPLQEWQNYAGTPLAVVDAAGQFGIGIASPVRQVHIRGSNAVARLDRNVDSASFIFVRTSSDFNTVWKTFTFGVKATGVDAGSFFIGDMHTNVSGSSDNRILIDTTGRVGIGTTTPSERLHVAGNVKATGFITGDIVMANDYKVTEDERDGVAFLNPKGEKIAVLDCEGNWHIRGKVMEDL